MPTFNNSVLSTSEFAKRIDLSSVLTTHKEDKKQNQEYTKKLRGVGCIYYLHGSDGIMGG